MIRVWTCQRVTKGKKCGQVNPRKRQICQKCGKKRPATKRPDHMAALNESYPVWVDIFGEKCGICGRKPSARRKLDRDHDHKTHAKRGLLCNRCNRALPNWVTEEWLYQAATYLHKAADLNKASGATQKLDAGT